MRFAQLTKDRAERAHIQVRNDEASATLPAGRPCCFVMDGTRDGLDAVRATTGAAAKATTFFAGIPNSEIANGAYGMAQVYGVIDNVAIFRQSRAATSDSYASYPAIALGDKLAIESVNNMLSRVGAGAASDFQAFAVGAEVAASGASSASATSDTSVLISSSLKCFLRAM